MNPQFIQSIAFEGHRRIACGELASVVRAAKKTIEAKPDASILIFNETPSQMVEVDYRGTEADVIHRLSLRKDLFAPAAESDRPENPEPRGPGRPKLGVIAREVTLLPRHWDWLNAQPGGASVAIRKLVEKARHENAGKDRLRLAQESAYRFISAMAGNEPGYEEAIRGLFAGDQAKFKAEVENWPRDVRDHALRLASAAWEGRQAPDSEPSK